MRTAHDDEARAGVDDIATTPVAASFSSVRNRTLVEQGDGRLIVKPSWRGRLAGLVGSLVFGAATAAAVAALWYWPRQPWWQFALAAAAWGFGLLLGTLLLYFFCGMLFDTQRFVFDRNHRDLVYGRLGWRRRCDLADIAAVQLLRGQRGRTDKEHANLHWPAYELNLVFRKDKSRLNLSSHGDLDWTFTAAQSIAGFLGVPLLDTGEGGTASRVAPSDRTEHAPQADVVPLAGYPQRTLLWEHRERLVLRRAGLERLIGGAFVLMGLVVSSLFLLNYQQLAHSTRSDWLPIIPCLLPLVFVVVGVFLRAERRICLDRARGELTCDDLWRRTARPLSDVAAVQVLFGGWHKTGRRSGARCRSYQVNLVMDDAARTRLHLTTERDATAALQQGRHVARFLDVPLAEKLDETRQPPAPVQPVSVLLRHRAWVVDTAPYVKSPNLGVRYATQVQSESADALVVSHLLSGCLLLLAGMFLVVAGLLSSLLWFTAAPALAFACVLGAVALPFVTSMLLFGRGFHRFDRTRGIVVFGFRAAARTRLLSDIVAVQLLHGPEAPHGPVYELNLVVDDPCEPRLPLAYSPDLQQTRQRAQRVASFLRVPLLEQRPGAAQA